VICDLKLPPEGTSRAPGHLIPAEGRDFFAATLQNKWKTGDRLNAFHFRAHPYSKRNNHDLQVTGPNQKSQIANCKLTWKTAHARMLPVQSTSVLRKETTRLRVAGSNHKSQITNHKFPSVESQIANRESQIPECASHSLIVPSRSSLLSS
jgi:hypothetical protein